MNFILILTLACQSDDITHQYLWCPCNVKMTKISLAGEELHLKDDLIRRFLILWGKKHGRHRFKNLLWHFRHDEKFYMVMIMLDVCERCWSTSIREQWSHHLSSNKLGFIFRHWRVEKHRPCSELEYNGEIDKWWDKKVWRTEHDREVNVLRWEGRLHLTCSDDWSQTLPIIIFILLNLLSSVVMMKLHWRSIE